MKKPELSLREGAEQLPRAEELFPSRQVAILASGEGTTFQAVLDEVKSGRLDIDLRALVTNRPESNVASRAWDGGIEVVTVDNDQDRRFAEALLSHEVGFAFCLGYDRVIPPGTVEAYRGRMLNLHPAPLPETKGKMGVEAHQIVKDKQSPYSGPTINWVTEDLDEGPAWKNRWVKVREGETAQELYDRCRVKERELVIEVLRDVASGRFDAR